MRIDTSKLDGLTLAKGAHESVSAGLCLLEAAAYVAGEPHSDHPSCVSHVVGVFGRSLNDVLPDDRRQQLVPLIPELIGTAGDGHDERRSYLAWDWLIRTWLPTWLELSPACRESGAKLRELSPIVDMASAERAGPVVRAGRAAAEDAAEDAARDAADAAAEAAAEDAGRAAAEDAAWAAARRALQPTVTALQESAVDLYVRMTRLGQEAVR